MRIIAETYPVEHTVNTLILTKENPVARTTAATLTARHAKTCVASRTRRAGSADLQALLLRGRRDDAVQAKVIDDLAVVIGDVPHRDDRDA
jgi:hypothetical protein